MTYFELKQIKAEVKKWRAEISAQLDQVRYRQMVAVDTLSQLRGYTPNHNDRRVVLIADIKQFDVQIASLSKLDAIYAAKLESAQTALQAEKETRVSRKPKAKTAREPHRNELNADKLDDFWARNNRQGFVRFAKMGSAVVHPSPLPLPVVEATDTMNTPRSHYISEEIDRRAAATLRWAPWNRRRLSSNRRYEGFSEWWHR